MPSVNALAATAALMGEPARAAMLEALFAGQALTATELARVAGIAAPTASAHLARLVAGGLVSVHTQGRHRYHSLAGEEVAAALESLGNLTLSTAPVRRWPHDQVLRDARLCWDHLAGRLGVAVHQALVGRGWLAPAAGGWATTETGQSGLAELGVDLAAAGTARRFACDCMDWSERRPHLAGGLGREFAACCLARGWLHRVAPGDGAAALARRRLALTPEGARRLDGALGVRLAA
jgi:DNA-binding transcriptional ArsR family regulator